VNAEEARTQAPTLDLSNPALPLRPQPHYAALQRDERVARAPRTGSPVLVRYEDILYALRHPEIFSSEMESHLQLGTERPMIPQQIDPPRQTKFRKILDPHFSRRRMLELEPRLREHAAALIEGFASRGRCEFHEEFAVPFPCMVFLEQIGLPQEDLGLFLELKDAIIRPGGPPDQAARTRTEAGRQIYAYFDRALEARSRGAPGEDMLWSLLHARIDGVPISREEQLDICFLLLLAGLDTVTATLGCSVLYLAENPEQRRRLLESPELIHGAVEELLRWETPVMMIPRLVKRDTEIGGVPLEAGQIVILLLGAANLDAAEFPEPEQVDFARGRNRHLAFGGGPHRCLGSHLARFELRIALEELHRRIPDYHLDRSEPPRVSLGIREVKPLHLVFGTARA